MKEGIGMSFKSETHLPLITVGLMTPMEKKSGVVKNMMKIIILEVV